jgi:preprotein translocase subunit SecA
MFGELKAAIQHDTVDALLKLLRNEVTVTIQRPEPQDGMPQNVHATADELVKIT